MAAAIGLTGAAAFEFVAHTSPAFGTTFEYIYPSAARTIFPGDPKGGPFSNHVAHNSSAPGVDYSGNGTGHGSPIVAVKPGTVSYVKSDNSGTYGRQVHIDHGDGSVTKYMHLKLTSVTTFAPVDQGTQIGQMGGSAEDSDTTYAAHIHICLLISGVYQDFALFVEGATPPLQKEEERMSVIYFATGSSNYTTVASTTSDGSSHPGGTVVRDKSMWFQECPGAPIFPLSGGIDYTTVSALDSEYRGWASSRATTAMYSFLRTQAEVGALIQLRGLTTKPIGNF